MAVRIKGIDVNKGESIFVHINESREHAIHVAVAKDGRCFVSGPVNNRERVFLFDRNGFKKSSKQERAEAIGG